MIGECFCFLVKTRESSGCGGKARDRCEYDCTNGHELSSMGNVIRGMILLKKCSSDRFARNISYSHSVVHKLSSIVNRLIPNKKIKLEFMKVISMKNVTKFFYTCMVKKDEHENIIAGLRLACQDKEVFLFFSYMEDKNVVFSLMLFSMVLINYRHVLII